MVERNIKIAIEEKYYEDFIKFFNENYEIEEGEDIEEIVIRIFETEPVENLCCYPSIIYEDETW